LNQTLRQSCKRPDSAQGLILPREKNVSREKPGANLGYWLQCLRVADPYQRLHAAMILGLMGEQAQGAVPALIEAMRDEDAQVRRMVTAALSEIGPASRTAVPALVTALRDRHEAVRCRAALSLAELGSSARNAVATLVVALQDPSIMVRRWAAFALGEVGPKAVSAMQALIELLREPSVITRMIAVVAIRKIGPAGSTALLSALVDANPQVRRYAASLLGKTGGLTRFQLQTLNIVASDPDPSACTAAREALAGLSEPLHIPDEITPPPSSLLPVE
jgi:HEAT repeat protein